MGLGTWSWGDKLTWGFGRGYSERDIAEAFEVSVRGGVNLIDTAEIYGFGNSERLIRPLLAEAKGALIVASKCFPYPWRWRGRSLLRALRGSLRRLGRDRIDLYQMHWPYPPVPIESWIESMVEAVGQGKVRAVGVSNYNLDQMRRAQRVLRRHGLTLASNQVEYSLLHRRPEENGVLETSQSEGITVIAYSPLAQGLLTGKYSPASPPPRAAGRSRRTQILRRLGPLLESMREIGEGRGGKTPAQVAINWAISRGTVPIPGAKTAEQALENLGAMGWRLSAEEMKALETASRRALREA
jgi:aryl-alcohol dehydrogenase-like predicted oxidoreductase